MRIRIIVLLSMILLLACNFASSILSSTETVDETPTIVVETSPTELASAVPIQPCPISPGESQLDETASLEEMPSAILDYLNSGGDFENLVLFLEPLSMVTTTFPPLIEKDFTGDGYLDILLVLQDPEPEFMLPSGTSILYQCQSDQYRIAYQSAISKEWGAPTIYSSADLNADTLDDLLIGRQSCGAHTCYEQVEVLSWNGATLVNLLQGSSEDMPSPIIEAFPEENLIQVTAQGIGSVGAGPFRRFVRRWIWDIGTASFLPSPDEFLPSPFRIHKLHDADHAVNDGEYDQALALYAMVIEDDELQDWGNPVTEREVLGAYASFRMIHTHLLMANSDSSEIAYNELISNYPPGSTGYDFAQMGEVFWMEYQATSDVTTACVNAQAFANSHQETIIDALYFGYANPAYTAEEICPTSN